MKNLHEKSPCCKASIRRFGGKRRQCIKCKRTWTLWPKRRGRKCKRESALLCKRYLDHSIPSLHAWSERKEMPADRLEARLARSRENFCRNTLWPVLPDSSPLILIADAMVFQLKRCWWTAYVMLLRKPDEEDAIPAPIVILPGKETSTRWLEALETLPVTSRKAIRALVCDGHRGFYVYALRQGKLLQRCHFHLLSAIQGRRSRWGQSRHRKEGEAVYKLVSRILEAPRDTNLKPLLRRVDDYALNTSSRELRKILRGFVTNVEDFRTYLYHPDLNLPTTSNTAESFIGCIYDLLRRARGFSSLKSLCSWLEALVKHRRSIKCRAAKRKHTKNQQN